MDADLGSSPERMEECRICHDKDEESRMEVPCFCRGSLKYAHRKCIQRWCDEKGNIVCEICQQPFKPDYIVTPPPVFRSGRIPTNSRRNREISRRDLRNRRLISEQHTSRPSMCGRAVTITFIVLLVLRLNLPFIVYFSGEYSVSLTMLLVLKTIGFLLGIYIAVKTLTAMRHLRNQQFSI